MTAAVKAEPRGLHAKLAEVMAEAERIPKNGTAPQAMGGFRFVQVGDAADAIRKALGERGVSMLPSGIDVVGESEHTTSGGKAMTTMTVRTTWTLVDSETGQTAVIQSLGAGADTGDKAAPKAQSNAMKYALLMGFLLSTGDDPEQTDTSDRQARSYGGGSVPSRAAADPTETLRPVGVSRITRTGKVAKGDSNHNDLSPRQTPDGHHVGFRLEIDGDKAIPQVCAEGVLGTAMTYHAAGLIGQTVTVSGQLFEVVYPGRRSYHRLVADVIQGDGWIVPAPDVDDDSSEASQPVPDGQAAEDAELSALPW